MKKFSEWPVKVLPNSGLNKRNRGLEVTGLPIPFQIGGVTCSPSVTADALSSICAQPLFTTTTGDRDIYLDSSILDADDLIADGSALKPYKSFVTAMKTIPRGLAHTVTLYPTAGIYDGFPVYNKFTNLGGRLKIDASGVDLRTMTGLTDLTVFAATRPNAQFSDSSAVTFKIEVTGTPFTNDSLCYCYAKFKTGASTGLMHQIISNDTNSFVIGSNVDISNFIVNGDKFDIVFLPVFILCNDVIIFDMDCSYGDCKIDDSMTIYPNLAIANVLFAWDPISVYYGAVFHNADLDFRHVQFSKKITVSSISPVLTFYDCSLNAFAPPSVDFYENTLLCTTPNIGISLITNEEHYPATFDGAVYINNSMYFCNICAPGCSISVVDSDANLNNIYVKYVFSANSFLYVLKAALDNPLSVNASFYVRRSSVTAEDVRIISSESAIDLTDEGPSVFICKEFAQIPLTLTGDYAVKMSGISQLKVYLSASFIMGAVGVAVYRDGDQSTEATLPVANTFVSNGAQSFIESKT